MEIDLLLAIIGDLFILFFSVLCLLASYKVWKLPDKVKKRLRGNHQEKLSILKIVGGIVFVIFLLIVSVSVFFIGAQDPVGIHNGKFSAHGFLYMLLGVSFIPCALILAYELLIQLFKVKSE